MNLAAGSILTLIGFLARFVFQIGRSVLLARFLGPAGRGIIGLLTTHCMTSSALGSLGLGNSFIYFMGKKKIDEETMPNYALIIGIFMGVFVAALAWFFSLIFKDTIFPGVPILFSVFAIPVMIIINYNTNIIRGQDRVVFFNIAYVLHMGIGFVVMAAVLIPIYFMKQSALSGLEAEALSAATAKWQSILINGAASSWFAGVVLSAIVSQIIARKGLKPGKFEFDLSKVKAMYKYSLKGYMQLVAENLNPVIGIFIIRYMLTASDVGLFIVANSLLTVMGTPIMSISFVLFPKLSRTDEDSTMKTALRVMKLVFIMLAAGDILLLLTGRVLVTLLFGSEFIGSVTPLFFLLPGLIGMGVFRILTDHLKSLNLPSIGSYASFIGLVFNIIITIKLLAPGRLYGASIGYSSSFIAAAFFILMYYHFKLGVPFRDLLLISRDDFDEYRRMTVLLSKNASKKIALILKRT